MTLASCQKQPYQDGQQSGRQQGQQGEVVIPDRLIPVSLILAFRFRSKMHMFSQRPRSRFSLYATP
jgi:hypothetical protein